MVPFVLSAVEIDVCPAQLVIQSLNEACASLTAKGLPGHEAVVAFMSDLVQLIEKSMQNIEASGAVRMLTLIPFEIRELIVNLSVFDTGFSLQLKEPMVHSPLLQHPPLRAKYPMPTRAKYPISVGACLPRGQQHATTTGRRRACPRPSRARPAR